MISELSKSSLKQTSLKQSLIDAFTECRAKTLLLFKGMDETTFCSQAHPDFSPVGWHLGHIAYTESLWILERTAALPCSFPQYCKLYTADGLPKNQRVTLPSLAETLYFLDTVRDRVLCHMEKTDLKQQERLYRFLLQHESQHSETISFVLELIKNQQSKNLKENYWHLSCSSSPLLPNPLNEMIQIRAGEFEMGSNSLDALDNERSSHKVYLDTYSIDRYPVTCKQYRIFMEAEGYKNRQWWSKAGWEWLQAEQATKPLYWEDNPAWYNNPVWGVSWYEAEAYAKFVGKRLPTEAEWEKAASWDETSQCRRIYPWGNQQPTPEKCNYNNIHSQTTPVNAYPSGQSTYGLYDTLGNVWEWTNSWFLGYEGFEDYPYEGYSQIYFDNEHRVLKGGSWATRPWALRSSFRNWYHPGLRQMFAGFRCAM
ncbi:TIGR03440 family protein [Rivularia sp. PCC 7116]|uniref:ergothioneine biosynthesis protein EgtB n=1 Tax=Rivularia sp. PCC 7116 TaxID=373994 RepID=UPI00029EF24F|nr:ergothioneine biosynthesis protein EgtB [Rivularia sp. PCC 7116]AFY56336.1 TIGR03440 family protein [Rivularia sp. PCC 7116]